MAVSETTSSVKVSRDSCEKPPTARHESVKKGMALRDGSPPAGLPLVKNSFRRYETVGAESCS